MKAATTNDALISRAVLPAALLIVAEQTRPIVQRRSEPPCRLSPRLAFAIVAAARVCLMVRQRIRATRRAVVGECAAVPRRGRRAEPPY